MSSSIFFSVIQMVQITNSKLTIVFLYYVLLVPLTKLFCCTSFIFFEWINFDLFTLSVPLFILSYLFLLNWLASQGNVLVFSYSLQIRVWSLKASKPNQNGLIQFSRYPLGALQQVHPILICLSWLILFGNEDDPTLSTCHTRHPFQGVFFRLLYS